MSRSTSYLPERQDVETPTFPLTVLGRSYMHWSYSMNRQTAEDTSPGDFRRRSSDYSFGSSTTDAQPPLTQPGANRAWVAECKASCLLWIMTAEIPPHFPGSSSAVRLPDRATGESPALVAASDNQPGSKHLQGSLSQRATKASSATEPLANTPSTASGARPWESFAC